MAWLLYRGAMFVDECVIKAHAGDGGRGCIAFRREKYEPWGGPNGGDGGRGGDVVLLGDHDTNNLVDFKFKPHWKGERGEHGLGKDCSGREGVPAILRLPLGTVVTDEATGQVVAELVEDGQRIVLCKGGNGGWGNTHFKTSTNRAPNRANPGQVGESGVYRLVLKSIADVGLVGFPNAGKSSLTTAITKARPKTAALSIATPAIRRSEMIEHRGAQGRPSADARRHSGPDRGRQRESRAGPPFSPAHRALRLARADHRHGRHRRARPA